MYLQGRTPPITVRFMVIASSQDWVHTNGLGTHQYPLKFTAKRILFQQTFEKAIETYGSRALDHKGLIGHKQLLGGITHWKKMMLCRVIFHFCEHLLNCLVLKLYKNSKRCICLFLAFFPVQYVLRFFNLPPF